MIQSSVQGTKQFPQCGFSNTVVQILRSCNVPFETVNVLADDEIRQGMKAFSQWPTFPQVPRGFGAGPSIQPF